MGVGSKNIEGGDNPAAASLPANEHSILWLVKLVHDGRFSSYFKGSSTPSPTRVWRTKQGTKQFAHDARKGTSRILCSVASSKEGGEGEEGWGKI